MIEKKIQFTIVVFSILLIISPTYANNCTWTPDDLYGTSFETYIANAMSYRHINSLAFSVLNGTEVFYSKGFGEQPGTDVAYHIMSASKMFTATAALQLYEDGLIGLDDNINDYLPYELKNPYFPDTTITIRHLLSHRSSLMGTWRLILNYYDLFHNGTLTHPTRYYEFYHENGSYYADDHWENFEPGTAMVYSDPGFDLLTVILENVTGIPFITYVTDNILNPLGMINTRHSDDDYSPEKLAVGYDYKSGVNTIVPYLNNSANPGGGGFYSTVEDMSKFMLAQLNQGDYNGTIILDPATVELMHTEIEASKYALGWMTRYTLGSTNNYQGHPGGPHEGFYVGNYIRNSIGVVIQLNQGNDPSIEEVTAHIFDLANKLLTEKTCPEESKLYLLPIISFIAIISVLKLRKRKV